MKVLDKVANEIVDVVQITNNGAVYHLVNVNGVVYRRFKDEVKSQ